MEILRKKTKNNQSKWKEDFNGSKRIFVTAISVRYRDKSENQGIR